jgi:hypothetical protein
MIPILILLSSFLLFKKKKKKMPNTTKYDIEKSLKEIFTIYGEQTAKDVERIYRLETANFSSGQFINSLSAGMEVGRDKTGKPISTFPYGWGSLRKFWDEQPTNRPTGFLKMKENVTGKEKLFIKFPSLFSAMFVLALTIKNRGGNAGAWHSTEEEKQKYYEKLLSSQKTTITDKIKSGVV